MTSLESLKFYYNGSAAAMKPSVPIPLDIIRHIVEHFCYDDIPTLQACSLVSRSFLTPSQKGLFHSIYLHRVEGHCQRLQCVFTDNPELLSYVRELYVLDYHPIAYEGRTYWTSQNEAFHTILKALPCLQLLSFKFTHNLLFPKDWKEVSVELKLALLHLCSLPSLNICELQGLDNIPVDFFDAFPHLKELSLFMITPVGRRVDEQQNIPPAPLDKVQLESLELEGGFDFRALFETIRASMDTSQLREVSIHTEFPRDVWETIKDSTSSLEILMWEYQHDHSKYPPHLSQCLLILELVLSDRFMAEDINLALFPKLRVFRFETVFALDPAFDPLPWISQSLRNIASAAGNDVSKLEEIGLDLSGVSKHAAEQLLEHAVWTDLDLLLSASPVFTNLQKFSVRVSFDPPFSGKLDPIDVEEYIFTSLPLLQQKGLLRREPPVFRIQSLANRYLVHA
jgi:F-box domain